VDFPGGGAGDGDDGLAGDDEGELVVLSGHGNGFAGVDHADVDCLGGNHDGAPGFDASGLTMRYLPGKLLP